MSECENCGEDRPLATLGHRPSGREADVCQQCIQREKRHIAERIANHEIGREVAA